MTIHEHDRCPPTAAATSRPRRSAHALVDRLNAGEPYAVAFGGQGSAWLETLEELVSSAGIEGRTRDAGRRGRTAARAGRQGTRRRPADRLRAAAVGARAGLPKSRVPAAKQLTSAAVSRARRPAHPDRRDARAGPPGHGSGRHPAGRRRRPLAGRAGRRGARRPRRQGRRAARAGPADRCGRHAGRRGGAASPSLGDRPPMVSVTNADPERIYELLEEFAAGRPHRAAPGAVHPQRPPLRRHHRHARAAVPLRAVLRARSRRRKKPSARARSAAAPSSRRSSTRSQVEVGFHTPRLADGVDIVGRLGRGGRSRRRAGPRDDRGHPRQPVDWVDEVTDAARGRRPLDPRPRARRHPDPADGAGDPRPGRRHRARRHPRRTAQPVHRRRGARGGPAVVELRADGRCACPTAGQAVDEVHPADRPFADPARRHDARPPSTPRSSPPQPTPATGPSSPAAARSPSRSSTTASRS